MYRLLSLTLALLATACAHTVQLGETAGSDWLQPWRHRHASRIGTPFVHPIGMEPAFLGRDLLISYHHLDAPGETEDEVEAEVEWAITDRLGVAIEAPFVRVSESGGATHEGVGDVAVAPRAVLVETDRLVLAASVGVTFPSGDSRRDLGSGEALLSPALTSWSDLGNGVTLQARIGTEHALETGDTRLCFHSALIWSMAEGFDHALHVPAGMVSLITEVGGRTNLDGPDESRTSAEVLFGLSYALGSQWELRGGYEHPVGGPQDIDDGFVVGAIFHF